MGDFSIDLLKYDTHGDSSDFSDAMYANFLLPTLAHHQEKHRIPRLILTTYFPIR